MTKKVNRIVKRIFESGIINIWSPYYLTSGYRSRYTSVVNYRSLNLWNFETIFKLYLYGNFIAILVFIIETFYMKITNWTLKKLKTVKCKIEEKIFDKSM